LTAAALFGTARTRGASDDLFSIHQYRQSANNTASWIGGAVPGSADTAQWNSTFTGSDSSLLGADMTWG